MAKQSKSKVDRIRFYVRKAAQYSRIAVSKTKPNSIRFQRLMAYKAAISRGLIYGGLL